MNRDELEDPTNVSSLLFQPNESSNNSTKKACQYVGPIKITNKAVVSGRGLIATRDISPGECLFVTPPTVSAHVQTVHKRWIALNNGRPGSLEEITEQVLVEEMKSILSNEDEHLMAESFLVLMGASASKTDCLSIEQLLGQRSSNEATAFSIHKISDHDLSQVIRKNKRFRTRFCHLCFHRKTLACRCNLHPQSANGSLSACRHDQSFMRTQCCQGFRW